MNPASLGVAAIYIASLAAVTLVAVGLGGANPPPATVLVAALLPVAVPILLARTASPERQRAIWVATWGLVLVVGLCLLVADRGPSLPYGDGGVLTTFVGERRAMPRWLAGSAVAGWLHTAVWEFPPIASRLPEAIRGPGGFLSVACMLIMCGGSAVLMWRRPGRLAVLLPMLMPLWLLFASGYVEYYPLVAVPLLAALLWLFEVPLGHRPPRHVGVLTGLLPCLYIGFAPISLIAFVAYGWRQRTLAFEAAAVAALTALLVVVVCWPEGVGHYLHSLYGVLNFGEASLVPRYAGMTAGEASVFFALPAVLSSRHVADLVYMTFWGGALLGAGLLAAALAVTARPCARTPGHGDRRIPLGAALVAWHLVYLVLMIPRLGPTRDIDLFFATTIVLPFVAGQVLDRRGLPPSAVRRAALVAAVLGASVGLALHLVWLGLPEVA